jgi:dTDP-4-amino-4,6-dideoxygalactose transaminase
VTDSAVTVPFVDLAMQHELIEEELDDAVRRVVQSSRFVLGPEVEAFEAEFASFCGVEHCVGVASGTDALVLALRAAGVEAGDEVITPSLTFVAGPLAIAAVGAVPVFVDVREKTYTIDPALAAAAVTPRTRAIMPVDLYGQCADYAPLKELADEHGLITIEDASQAHGATYRGVRAGGFGDLACFSFYPSKNLGAFGDAGAVVTRNPALAERLRLLRNYGETRKYHHESFGLNSRLDELQAAVLRAKLPHLDEWNASRRRAASRYAELLAGSGVGCPEVGEERTHVFHLYAVRCEARDDLQAALAANGVSAQIHYPLPVHRQPVLAQLRHVAGDLPVSDRVAGEVLSLPMYPAIDSAQIEHVADAVCRFTSG